MKKLKLLRSFGHALLVGMIASCLAPAAAYAVGAVSNPIYEARVDESADSSPGSWMAFTAAGHPTGAGNDLMFREFSGGTTQQNTNFSSLRVYDGGGGPIDYTFDGNGGGIDLDDFLTAEGATPMAGIFAGIVDGHRTEWDVTPEEITIIQDVVIVGTTFANSAIYHTVELTNTGSATRSVGWRNLYDWSLDGPTDDGPSNQVELSDGTPVVPKTDFEFSHTPGTDELVRVGISPGTPTYEPLLALGFDPGFLPSLPVTIPDEFAYVDWDGSFSTAFDYTPLPPARMLAVTLGWMTARD